MTRVVLDANVLAPGFLGTTSASARQISLWRQDAFQLVVSVHLLLELIRTYRDPYFSARITPQRAALALRLLRRRALSTRITVPVSGVATQPKDDLIIATALSGDASYLGTRDRQLLKLGSHQGLQILHPADLLETLLRLTSEQTESGFDET